MSKLKKIVTSILAFIFLFGLVTPFKIANADALGKTYVKVYYTRDDNNYSGWNLWLWVNGKKAEVGHAVEFDGVDSKGAYKIIEKDSDAGNLGIIVRTESWEKCYEDDVLVDLSKGDTEIDFNQATKSYTEVTPKQEFESIKAKIHYYRFDETYDNWDLWTWPSLSNNHLFGDEITEFGKVSEVNYSEVKADADAGFIVRVNDWSNREQSNFNDGNRFINKTCINADGEVNVYIIQGDKNTYYTSEAALLAKEPKIFSSKIDTFKTISFTTSFEVGNVEDITLTNSIGEEILISETLINEDNKSGIVTVAENLDFANEKYTISMKDNNNNVVNKEVTLGRIYETSDFADLYTYDGELGAIYTSNKTTFVLWAPTAVAVDLDLYGTNGGDLSTPVQETIPMTKGLNGTWVTEVSGDLNGTYYNYKVSVEGKVNEVVDPYAKAVGVNGTRAMVINLDETDPEGWNAHYIPKLESATDAVIYEMHIRDFTIGVDSGVGLEYKGKFKGIWQPSTTIPGTNITTGIEHLKELGVNTVQILPVYDYNSVDESKLNIPQFNWGYDPQNYNSVEGSYSSDPYKAEIRIKEFKELIQALHQAGIRVTMDVVYNHTALSEDSNLSLAVPNYYYRQTESGGFSNGSGCGNELASERSMVRKLMVDSVKYWATEYKLDGFRFDLMALLDVDTMKEIRMELDKIDPTISIIGEGWTGGASTLDSERQSLKANTGLNFGDMQIAAFSDDMRDGIKGHVFDSYAPAFINGGDNFEETVKFGIVAATTNDQIDYSKVANKTKPWATEPYQSVNYASAHDNLTLYDKLKTTNPKDSEEEIIAMNKMAAAFVYTSQGIPFMLSGEEFARTKVNPDGSFNENSYNSSDEVNHIGWSRKIAYNDLFEYYKGLIKLRGNHKIFRMDTTLEIQENLKFIDVKDKNVVAYTLNGAAVNDSWNNIAVVFNSNKTSVEVTLPSNDWVVVVNESKAGEKSLKYVKGNKVKVPAQASYVLVDMDSYKALNIEEETVDNVSDNKDEVVTIGEDKEFINVTIDNAEELKDNKNSIIIEKPNKDLIVNIPYSVIPKELLTEGSKVEIDIVEEPTESMNITGLNNVINKIFRFYITVIDKDGNKTSVHEFTEGTLAEIMIQLTKEEMESIDVENAWVYYLDEETGEIERVSDVVFDIEKNTVTFKTSHFSSFIIGDKKQDKPAVDNGGKDTSSTVVDKKGNTTSSANGTKTGDNININAMTIILFISATIAGSTVVMLRRKKVRE